MLNIRILIRSITLCSLFLAVPSFADATNSSAMLVTSIESRSNGLHDIYFDGVVPNQDCTLQDRAVLIDADTGSDAMFSVLLSAFISSKEIVIRVEGCEDFRPHIIKVQAFQ